MPTEEEKFQIDDCRIVLGNGGLVVGNYKSDHNNPCKGSKMTTGDNLVKVINMEVQHELLFTGDLADQIADSNGCCTITALITDINSKITGNSGDLEEAKATIAADLKAAEDQIAKDLVAAEAKIAIDLEAAEAQIAKDLNDELVRAKAAEAKITTSAYDNSKPFVGYSELGSNTPVKIIQDYTKYLKLVQISDTEIATLCLRDNDDGVPFDGKEYGHYESKCIHYISGPNKNN